MLAVVVRREDLFSDAEISTAYSTPSLRLQEHNLSINHDQLQGQS